MGAGFGLIKSKLYKVTGDFWRPLMSDAWTWALLTMGYAHHEVHEGNRYFLTYSVASLGAMTTPDDMITLTFTTPNTTKWSHFQFYASGTAGWRLRFIEGSTGGGATPTGSLTPVNHDRNSTNVSTLIDVAGTPAANRISYDATLLTGGTTLWDEYLGGTGGPQSGQSNSGSRDEIVLKQNTKYQVSLFGTDTNPATLHLDWYEHTNKDT